MVLFIIFDIYIYRVIGVIKDTINTTYQTIQKYFGWISKVDVWVPAIDSAFSQLDHPSMCPYVTPGGRFMGQCTVL